MTRDDDGDRRGDGVSDGQSGDAGQERQQPTANDERHVVSRDTETPSGGQPTGGHQPPGTPGDGSGQSTTQHGQRGTTPQGATTQSLLDILMSDWGLTVRLVLAAAVVGLFYYIAAGILSIPFVTSAGDGVAFLVGLVLTVVLIAVSYYRAVRGLTTGEDMSEYPVDADPELHQRVDEMAATFGISRPLLMRKEMGVLNAYAIGRAGDGYIVLSDRLIDTLSQEELEAVVAHEMAHLKHRGSIIQSLAGTARDIIEWAVLLVVGVYVFVLALLRYRNYRFVDSVRLAIRSLTHGLSGKILGAVVSVVGAFMLVFTQAFSRYREYLADHRAASTVGSHEPMVSALQRIDTEAERAPPQQEQGDHEQGDVPLSLCIDGRVDSILGHVFATHPSPEKRINRLQRAFDPATGATQQYDQPGQPGPGPQQSGGVAGQHQQGPQNQFQQHQQPQNQGQYNQQQGPQHRQGPQNQGHRNQQGPQNQGHRNQQGPQNQGQHNQQGPQTDEQQDGRGPGA